MSGTLIFPHNSQNMTYFVQNLVVLVPGQPAVNLTMERDACNYTWIVSSDEVPWWLI